MGKKGSWVSAIKRVFTPHSKEKLGNQEPERKNGKEKSKKRFGKLRHGETNSFLPIFREPSSIEKILGEAERDHNLVFRPHSPARTHNKMIKMVLKIVVMVIVFTQILAPIAEAAVGRAVFYDPPYTRSACYGRQYQTMVTGVRSNLWQGSRACGHRFRVRCIGPTYDFPRACTGRTIIVTVVDFCREPCDGDLNLSRDAFGLIANTNAGNVRVEYTPI